MANFFTKLIGGGADTLVGAVGTALDKVFTSDEEKKALENELAKASLQHEAEMARLGLDETRAYLGDIADARKNQSDVQSSEHSSWLAKNIQPMLAVAIVGLTFWMYWYIMFSGKNVLSEDKEMKDIIIYVLGALTTVSTQVVSYFFGSSQGSSRKQRTIDDMARKQAG